MKNLNLCQSLTDKHGWSHDFPVSFCSGGHVGRAAGQLDVRVQNQTRGRFGRSISRILTYSWINNFTGEWAPTVLATKLPPANSFWLKHYCRINEYVWTQEWPYYIMFKFSGYFHFTASRAIHFFFSSLTQTGYKTRDMESRHAYFMYPLLEC